MIFIHCSCPTHYSVMYGRNIIHLRYFHTEALPPPLPFRLKVYRRKNQSFAFLFLPSLNNQIAFSMKRGQTNRRIPSNNKNKQEAHVTHRSPEKQFQSINTFAHSIDYAITLRENNYYLVFEN